MATALVVLDQIFKSLVEKNIALGESIVIIPKILSLTLTHNTGMAFGMLSGQAVTLSMWIAVIVTGLVIYYYDEVTGILSKISLALILGGTIGNFIDRAKSGYVIDYLNLHVWPIFNLADIALTAGVVLLVIGFWKREEK